MMMALKNIVQPNLAIHQVAHSMIHVVEVVFKGAGQAVQDRGSKRSRSGQDLLHSISVGTSGKMQESGYDDDNVLGMLSTVDLASTQIKT